MLWQFIYGLSNVLLQQHLLNQAEKLDFKKTLDKATTAEYTSTNLEDMSDRTPYQNVYIAATYAAHSRPQQPQQRHTGKQKPAAQHTSK